VARALAELETPDSGCLASLSFAGQARSAAWLQQLSSRVGH